MFRKLINLIKEGQQRKVAYWQLQNMTNQQLKDIGVSRSEIKNKVYGEQSWKLY
jgi:uncharacterized protein YjiS (DUF1127 family)